MQIVRATDKEFRHSFGDAEIKDGDYKYFKTDSGIGIRKNANTGALEIVGKFNGDDRDTCHDYEMLSEMSDPFRASEHTAIPTINLFDMEDKYKHEAKMSNLKFWLIVAFTGLLAITCGILAKITVDNQWTEVVRTIMHIFGK